MLINYSQIQYEFNTLSMDLKSYSDEDLVQEAAYLLATLTAKDIEAIVSKYLKLGKLEGKERIKLETFYKLINLEYGWNV